MSYAPLNVRIRGKVGQATEPEEVKGKWFFEVWMTEFGGGECNESNSLGKFGPWNTADIAETELQKCVKMISEMAVKRANGGKMPEGPSKYINVKTNTLEGWPELCQKCGFVVPFTSSLCPRCGVKHDK